MIKQPLARASQCARGLVRALGLALVAAVISSATLMAQPTRSDSKTPAPEVPLVRLDYQNPKLVVDLAVGLWAEPLPIDYDGDGDLDLVVCCPDKPYNGTYLFENPGLAPGAKLPIFKPARRIDAGQRHLTVNYVDGKLRVLGPGYEYRDFLSKIYGDRQPIKLPFKVHQPKGNVRSHRWSLVDYDGDGVSDLLIGGDDWGDYGWDNAWDSAGKWKNGPLHGLVYIVRNAGTEADPKWEEPLQLTAGGKPVDVFGFPCPALADFDLDGDLDLICGEFLDGFTLFENTGSRKKPEFAAGKRLTAAGQPLVLDLCMIVPHPVDWDSDGDVDLVVGDEDGRVALVENLATKDQPGFAFAQPVYFQQEAGPLKFGALVTPVGFDWDNDGDDDIVCGNTAGYIAWIENLGLTENGLPKWAAPQKLMVTNSKGKAEIFRVIAGPNGSIQGPAEAKWGYTTIAVADWNHDSLPDIVLNSIWGKVEWLENIGTRTKPKLAAPQPIEVAWETATGPKPEWTWWNPTGKELVTQWRTTPVAIDFTGDGLIDLVMLDHEGYLSLFERAKRGDATVLLPPKHVLVDEKHQPLKLSGGIAGKSGRRKLTLADRNGDGRLDLLLNSRNAAVFEQQPRSGELYVFGSPRDVSTQNIEGHDTSPTLVDFNRDGTKELLIGAEDGHFYYLPANPAAVVK